MNGNKNYLLDTNAVIALLKGNNRIVELCNSADQVSVSIISEIEFMSFRGLTQHDKNLFQIFKNEIKVIDLCSTNNNLIETIYEIRKTLHLKLPDAIITASAIVSH